MLKRYLTTRFHRLPESHEHSERKMAGDTGRTGGMDFLGARQGGIAAYRNANELNPPREFYFALLHGRGLPVATHGLLVSAGRY